ncbi:MAG: tRNA epoxyqueuosine(34) reductase QueG [Methylococcaceae bacterium]
MNRTETLEFSDFTKQLKQWGKQLGFQQVGITDTNLEKAEQYMANWVESGFQGTMGFMTKHGIKRSRPEQLIPGTIRIISVRMDYLPEHHQQIHSQLDNPIGAYISRYALGRDYHKVLRKRLQRLADQISEHVGEFGYRVFVDSAPVLEKALAEKAGLGWIGKHTNLINKEAGSWFFLGEIYTDLPLVVDSQTGAHCGDCQTCIDICPTQAIVGPYRLDARRCISYLTIENKGSIPLELRPLIGNRVYGCDDCQLVCPWNRFAQLSQEVDFHAKQGLGEIELLTIFAWSEQDFLCNTEGTAIRRIGYMAWIRNIAVALGNAPYSENILQQLEKRSEDPSNLIKEHVNWAIQQQLVKAHSEQ